MSGCSSRSSQETLIIEDRPITPPRRPLDGALAALSEIAPRLGFAWQASGGSRPLVVRGGYSLVYVITPMKTLVDNFSVGIPFRSNPIYAPDSVGYYPDGRPGWSMRIVPTCVAGQNTRTVLDNLGGTLGLTAGALTGAFIDSHYPDARPASFIQRV